MPDRIDGLGSNAGLRRLLGLFEVQNDLVALEEGRPPK